MRFAIFITSGIGNALLLVPLIKSLRNKGTVTCFAASPFGAEAIFEGFKDDLFDAIVDVSGKSRVAKAALKYATAFDEVHLDYFSSGRQNLLLALAIGKRVFCNKIPLGIPASFRTKLSFIEPIAGIHEGTQYMRYTNGDFQDTELTAENFRLTPRPTRKDIPKEYVTLQPGSGNNLTPWKTWPTERWQEIAEWLMKHNDHLKILILGDQSEREMSKKFEALGDRVVSFIGKTTLKELPGIIGGAQFHLGGDSGLLHIAGCCATPSLTIWGGSDPVHFGWQKLDSELHTEIRIPDLPCHPCNRWIAPNRSKAAKPEICPDFRCIREIETSQLIEALTTKLNLPRRSDVA